MASVQRIAVWVQDFQLTKRARRQTLFAEITRQNRCDRLFLSIKICCPILSVLKIKFLGCILTQESLKARIRFTCSKHNDMKKIKENIGYVLFVLAYIGVCALLMYLSKC